ncbi:MAG: AraC family transcriptional regulator [Bacteroidia bacterium]
MQIHHEHVQVYAGAPLLIQEFSRAASRWPYHRHETAYELTWKQGLSGTRFVGDHIGPFAGPELVLIAPGLPHCWHIPEEAATGAEVCVRVFHFHPAVLGGGWETRPAFASIRGLLAAAAQGVTWPAADLATLQADLTIAVGEPSFAMVMQFLHLLQTLARSPRRQVLCSAGFQPTGGQQAQTRVQQVHRHLVTHYRDAIGLARVADLLGLSPSAFSHFFRKHFAKSFTQYLCELRLGAAARSLIETDLPVSQVCYACSFENLSHFNRQFKATYHCTPTAYRQLWRQPG